MVAYRSNHNVKWMLASGDPSFDEQEIARMDAKARTGFLPYLDSRIRSALERAGIRVGHHQDEAEAQREVWSAETRELYQGLQPAPPAYPALLPLTEFHQRLTAEI